MSFLEWLAALLGTKKGIAIAGFFGSLLASFLGPKRTWKERTVTFVAGFFSAVFLTTPLIVYLNVKAGDYEGGIGFLLGCFAMALADKALSLLKDFNLASISGLFGKGK